MSKEETQRVLSAMNGTTQLMAKLLYGSGIRLMECIRMRVKDIDFEINEIRVHSGKGDRDRLVPLPESIKTAFKICQSIISWSLFSTDAHHVAYYEPNDNLQTKKQSK